MKITLNISSKELLSLIANELEEKELTPVFYYVHTISASQYKRTENVAYLVCGMDIIAINEKGQFCVSENIEYLDKNNFQVVGKCFFMDFVNKLKQ